MHTVLYTFIGPEACHKLPMKGILEGCGHIVKDFCPFVAHLTYTLSYFKQLYDQMVALYDRMVAL